MTIIRRMRFVCQVTGKW